MRTASPTHATSGPRAAWYEDRLSPGYRMTMKSGNALYEARQDHSPYDVVAWYGNHVPLVYDLVDFSPVVNGRVDHINPSVTPYSTARSTSPTAPVLDYGRAGGECSVIGGVVVRDPRLTGLAGRYVYGDYCTGALRSFRIAGGKATGDRGTGLRVSQLSSFGEDARGRVYATSLDGPVYRLTPR